MPDLAEQLRAVIDGAADPITMDEIRGERTVVLRTTGGGSRRPHRGWIVGTLAAAAAIIAAIVVSTRSTAPDVDPIDSVVTPVTTAAPTPSTTAAQTTLPTTTSAPITTVAPAAFVPTADRWQDMARAPIDGRSGAFTVWTGKELLISAGTANHPPWDGAAYDPATDTWRAMAPIPGDDSATGPDALWTGTEALFLHANTMNPPPRLYAYNPETDSWLSFPTPFSQASELISVWTGREMLVFTSGFDTFASPDPGTSSGAPPHSAFDPATGQWRALDGLSTAGLRIGSATWMGDAAILTGTADGDQTFMGSYDPERGVLTPLDVPSDRGLSGPPVAVVGDELVFVQAEELPFDPPRRYQSLTFVDPATNTWRAGAAPPCIAPEQDQPTKFGGPPAMYVGGVILLDCLDGPIAVYDPTTDLWTTRDFGTNSLGRVRGSSVAVIDDTLLVWAGPDGFPIGVRLTVSPP